MVVFRRALSAALLACMLGVTMVVWFMATANFRVVDHDRNPRIDEIFSAIDGPEARKMAVRYLASESNRALFSFTAPLQLVLVSLAWAPFVWRRRRPSDDDDRGRAGRGAGRVGLLLACLAILSLAMTLLVPWFVEEGRGIDFVRRTPVPPPEVEQFLRVHLAYVLLDGLRAVGALALMVSLLRTRGAPA